MESSDRKVYDKAISEITNDKGWSTNAWYFTRPWQKTSAVL